jgi:hypothetical protein
LPPEAVGKLVWRILTMAKPRTRYAILRKPFMDSFLPRALPPRFVDRMVARTLGITPR